MSCTVCGRPIRQNRGLVQSLTRLPLALLGSLSAFLRCRCHTPFMSISDRRLESDHGPGQSFPVGHVPTVSSRDFQNLREQLSASDLRRSRDLLWRRWRPKAPPGRLPLPFAPIDRRDFLYRAAVPGTALRTGAAGAAGRAKSIFRQSRLSQRRRQPRWSEPRLGGAGCRRRRNAARITGRSIATCYRWTHTTVI